MFTIQLLYELLETICETYTTTTGLANFEPEKKTITDFEIDQFVVHALSKGNYIVIGFVGDRVAVQNIERGYSVTINPNFLRKIECPNDLFKTLYSKK